LIIFWYIHNYLIIQKRILKITFTFICLNIHFADLYLQVIFITLNPRYKCEYTQQKWFQNIINLLMLINCLIFKKITTF